MYYTGIINLCIIDQKIQNSDIYMYLETNSEFAFQRSVIRSSIYLVLWVFLFHKTYRLRVQHQTVRNKMNSTHKLSQYRLCYLRPEMLF